MSLPSFTIIHFLKINDLQDKKKSSFEVKITKEENSSNTHRYSNVTLDFESVGFEKLSTDITKILVGLSLNVVNGEKD